MNSHKKKIREEIRRLRSELSLRDKEQMDGQIRDRMLKWLKFQKAETVYLYASLAGEVDTWGLMEQLWKKGVSTALPRVEGKELVFCFVDKKELLEKGAYGIWEPKKVCQMAEERKTVVITPGLAFSLTGERIGYGGGYYDRFFEREPEHVRVALAYPFQVKECVVSGHKDQRVHWIVTPEKVAECVPVISDREV